MCGKNIYAHSMFAIVGAAGALATAAVLASTAHPPQVTTKPAKPNSQMRLGMSTRLGHSKLQANGRTHYYQIPPNPRGLVVVFPGCSRSGPGFWPEMLGFPQDVSHTKQILAKRYAILVLTPVDTKTMCWSGRGADPGQAVSTITDFMKANSLTGKPVFFLGASSGAGMMVRMQDSLAKMAGLPWRVSGIISEVGTNAEVSKSKFPPAVWVVMQRDAESQREAQSHVASLIARGIPAAFVVSPIRPITPSFFSDLMDSISPEQSQAISAGMRTVGIVDSRGGFTQDPKGDRGWTTRLQKLLSFKVEFSFNRSAMWQAILYAYAKHEHVANYTTAALTWFEGGGKGSFADMAARYQVDKPASV